jgi:hypothetical protein
VAHTGGAHENEVPSLRSADNSGCRDSGEIRPLTGSGRFVFPGERDRSWARRNNTVNAALWRLAAESHLIRSRAPLLEDRAWRRRVEGSPDRRLVLAPRQLGSRFHNANLPLKTRLAIVAGEMAMGSRTRSGMDRRQHSLFADNHPRLNRRATLRR